MPSFDALRDPDRRRRLIVVSYLANAAFSPRGIRTRALLDGLRDDWTIELIAGPAPTSPPAPDERRRRPVLRKGLRFAHSSIMLDKYELWGRRQFRSWQPPGDAALLIGYPFSPIVYAARRLAEYGIPYVVDAGDPWVLTSLRPENRGLGRIRGRAAEYALWRRAAGAVVTTEAQANALGALFPELPILVRPNGFYSSDQMSLDKTSRRTSRSSILRLVHFGDISSERVPIAHLLESLADAGGWDEVQFHEFGSDWTNALRRLRNVTVVFHSPRAWSEIVESAGDFDLAVVVGNRDAMLLPSKVISYLQLPIPRLAIVERGESALTQYIWGKPGWTAVHVDSKDAAETIRKHISRGWSDAELAPPASESWERVTQTIAQFLEAVTRGGATGNTVRQRRWPRDDMAEDAGIGR